MATEILRPQDCLIRVPPAASTSRRRSYVDNHCNYYHHSNHHASSLNRHPSTSRSYRKHVTRPDQRRGVSVGGSSQPAVAEAAPVGRRTPSVDDSRINTRSSGYATEKVTILRRGQSLDPPSSLSAMRTDVYAGSAFAMSPSPSALPLPSFPTKKQISPSEVDDSATRDLRRLLRLE